MSTQKRTILSTQKVTRAHQAMIDQEVLNAWSDTILPELQRLIEQFADRNQFVHRKKLFGFYQDSPQSIADREKAFKMKQIEGVHGNLAQVIFGNFPGWEDLKTGHESGVDIRKKDGSMIIELKSNWNTFNSASKESTIKKSETTEPSN